jgi:hypothetical protein
LQEGLEAGHWQPQQEQALLEAEARQLLLELGVLVEDSAGCCWHCPSLSLSGEQQQQQQQQEQDKAATRQAAAQRTAPPGSRLTAQSAKSVRL